MIFDPVFQETLVKSAPRPSHRTRPPALSALTPRGAIDPAGATSQLLLVLASKPRRFWMSGEILAAMPEKKNLNWSLRYAFSMGWIERTSDARASRYLRYRITRLGMRIFE